ncbi:MAG: TonB-dependent receptor [Tabrizicola sp.]|jgi:hemoglobin/transferrin/lactoferrin receptor protein|nr:TonB-dependent receptor [Tabrizicola sp.]
MPTLARPAKRGLILSTALVLSCTAPALAQEADEGLFQMLGRIIFGAGTAKVAIDTPQAVTALEQEDLDRKQASSIAGIVKGVPGVQAAGAASRPLGQAFNIRGIGNTEQTASEERIKVIVDGAPKFFEAYRLGSFFADPELFKRVEILRGPASSTLYGSGTVGGAVVFTTKDASDFLQDGETTALRFRGSYASNGDQTGVGVIYAHRAGNAEFLAALNGSASDAMTDGSGATLETGDQSGASALVKGKWSLGNDADQDLSLSFSRTDVAVDDAPVDQTTGTAGFGTHDVTSLDDTLTATWHHGVAANDLLDLTVQLSHTRTDVTKRDFSLGAFCAPGRSAVLCDSDYGYATTTLKIENIATLSAGLWESYLTTGLQLSRQERSATSIVGPLGFHPEGIDEKLGLYAQGEFVWNGRLTLIPGLRVDFGQRTPSAATIAAGGAEVRDEAVSATFSAMYKLSDSVSVFGTLASTERMPTLDELYTAENGLLPSLGLEKEQADSVELGLTFQRQGLLSEGDSLLLKATLFHNDFSNLIASNTGAPAGSPRFVNIRDAEIWGGEIEAAYDADRWFASLGYSKVKSRDGVTGLTLQDTPAASVALTLGAKLPDQGLLIGWKAYYYDDITTYTNGTATPNTIASGESFDTHDLFVTWAPQTGALEGFNVNLTVENVFDAAYKPGLSAEDAPGLNAKLTIGKALTW